MALLHDGSRISAGKGLHQHLCRMESYKLTPEPMEVLLSGKMHPFSLDLPRNQITSGIHLLAF